MTHKQVHSRIILQSNKINSALTCLLIEMIIKQMLVYGELMSNDVKARDTDKCMTYVMVDMDDITKVSV